MCFVSDGARNDMSVTAILKESRWASPESRPRHRRLVAGWGGAAAADEAW